MRRYASFEPVKTYSGMYVYGQMRSLNKLNDQFMALLACLLHRMHGIYSMYSDIKQPNVTYFDMYALMNVCMNMRVHVLLARAAT